MEPNEPLRNMPTLPELPETVLPEKGLCERREKEKEMSNPAVLISIRPEWVEKILAGEKTVEIRKRKPYFGTPFKCYIYCTKGGKEKWQTYTLNGTVCAEFTCDYIQNFSCPFPAYNTEVDKATLKDACVSFSFAHRYLGHKSGYAWHISDVKVYDQPMIPEDFRYYVCTDRVKTAPQSFMYVNELEEI